MEKKYDIFISYRREGGYDTAKHLNDLLVRDGYKVSFDIDTLRSGDFDTQLLTRIDQCKDFILIVDAHAFDRTLDPNFDPKKDWMRQELAHALKKGKNIIPVLLSDVKGFPQNLPIDIAAVSKKNGPEYNRYYFNDFYEKLKKDFLTSRRKWISSRTIIVFCLIIMAFVILSKFFGDSFSYEKNILQDSIDVQTTVDIDYTSPDLAFKELKGHVKCMNIQEFSVKKENGEYVVSGIREYLDGFESKKLRDDFDEEGNLIGNIQEYRWPADMDCWSKAKWTELNPSQSFTAQIKEVLHGYTAEHNHTITLSRDENGYVKKIVYDCDSEDDYEKFYSCTPTTFEYFWEDGHIKKITEGPNSHIYVYDSDGYLKSMDVESYGEENTMTRSCLYYSKYKYDNYGNWIERLVTVEGQYGDAGDENDARYTQLEPDSTERYIEKREIEYYK